MSQVTIPNLPLNAGLTGSELLEISNAGISEHTSVLGFAAIYEQISEKNAANGYAGLDASSLLRLANFPSGTALQLLRRNAGNTALEFVDQPPNSDTPWTEQHDASANNLINLGFIAFGAGSADTGNIRLPNAGTIEWEAFPFGTNGSIIYTATEAIEIFAGNVTAFSIQPALFQPNRTVSLGINPLEFVANTQSIQNDGSSGIQYDVATANTHTFRVNDISEYTLSSTQADWLANNLINVGLLNLKINNTTANLELEANHTTPANNQVIGNIDFVDDNSIGTRKIYARIQSQIQIPTSTLEDGELHLDVIDGGTLTNYIELNPGFAVGPVTVKVPMAVNAGIFFGTAAYSINTIANNLTYDTAISQSHDFRVNDVVEYSFNSTQADFLNNNLVNVGFLDFGTGSADAGTIRLPNAATIEWEAAPAGVNGSITYNVNEIMTYDATTQHIFQTGGADRLRVGPTFLDCASGIALINVGHIRFFTGPIPNAGAIRTSNNQDFAWRNAANTNNHNLTFNTLDEFELELDAVSEYTFSATQADFNNNNITNVGFIDFGTGSADVGTVRLPNTGSIQWEASPAGNNGIIDFSTGEQIRIDPAGLGQAVVISSTAMNTNRNLVLDNFEIQFSGATATLRALNGLFLELDTTAREFRIDIAAVEKYTFANASADFHTNNLVNATLATGTVFSVIPTINDGITFTFNPNATVSGVNVGAHTANPSTPVNGDVWYNSTTNTLFGRINGINTDLGAAGAGSPPFTDSISLVEGSVDPTKEIRFEVDGLTTGTVRVITMPDADVTLVNTSDGLIVDAQTGTFTTTKISTLNKSLLNSAIVYNDQINTFGDFAQVFADNRLTIQTPLAAGVVFNFSAPEIAANRTITLPLLLGNDIMVTEAFAQTLSNKTLTAPIFADLGFIADANSNEMLIFDTVTAAVNEFTIANAATGTGPVLSVTGGNTDIDLNVNAKGTGIISLNSDTKVTGQFNLDVAGLLTIATAAITVTKSFHRIEGEGAAADTLSTINGGVEGDVLVLRSNTTANDIIIDEAGNIILNTAGSFILTNVQDTIVFIFDGTNWLEISRSDNTV